MNTEEARQILDQELKSYDDKSYEELVKRIGELSSYPKKAAERFYQIEIQVMWDSEPQRAVRVIGSIDDGGWRAFSPLTDSILKFPPD